MEARLARFTVVFTVWLSPMVNVVVVVPLLNDTCTVPPAGTSGRE